MYIWKGSDEWLKPLVLTAHMGKVDMPLRRLVYVLNVSLDVVPVNPETHREWRQPPFSGFYDGKDAPLA